jgi:hypothetical protein
MRTFDRYTIDAAGAFMVGELERLDQTLHLPLVMTTWGWDIDLRSDVTIADEVSSFTNTSFAAPGGINPKGKNWVSDKSTAIPGIAVNIGKTDSPMRLWGLELGFTLIELAKSQQVGRPIDSQKYEGMKLKYGMDVDAMIYIGDQDVGATGLINSAKIAPTNADVAWDDPEVTPGDILDSVNEIINIGWKNSAYAVCPSRLLLPPKKYSLLTRPVTLAGSKSLLTYIAEECVANGINGRPLEIFPLKWLVGRGVSGADRAVAYTKNPTFVRYPMVPLQHTPVEYRGLVQLTTYYCTLGEVEFVYPETITYMDGI